MAKVKGRTEGLITGAIDRCELFPTTIPILVRGRLELDTDLTQRKRSVFTDSIKGWRMCNKMY
jgi:hypothetical protein